MISTRVRYVFMKYRDKYTYIYIWINNQHLGLCIFFSSVISLDSEFTTLFQKHVSLWDHFLVAPRIFSMSSIRGYLCFFLAHFCDVLMFQMQQHNITFICCFRLANVWLTNVMCTPALLAPEIGKSCWYISINICLKQRGLDIAGSMDSCHTRRQPSYNSHRPTCVTNCGTILYRPWWVHPQHDGCWLLTHTLW